jgi:hypothetical protein
VRSSWATVSSPLEQTWELPSRWRWGFVPALAEGVPVIFCCAGCRQRYCCPDGCQRAPALAKHIACLERCQREPDLRFCIKYLRQLRFRSRRLCRASHCSMRLQGSNRQCLNAIPGGCANRFKTPGFGYLEALSLGLPRPRSGFIAWLGRGDSHAYRRARSAHDSGIGIGCTRGAGFKPFMHPEVLKWRVPYT